MKPVLDYSASFGDNNEDFNIYNRVQNLQAYHPKDYNDFSALVSGYLSKALSYDNYWNYAQCAINLQSVF